MIAAMQAKVDVDGVRSSAFSLSESLAPVASDWHHHRKHQLLYAASGTLQLEADARQWLLPPQRAAWLRAGCEHRVRIRGPVLLRTIYIDDALVAHLDRLTKVACLVFPATPVLREMILYGMRWGPGRDARDAEATRFFVACAEVCARAAEAILPLWLPTARSSDVARAMDFTLANLADKLSQSDVARAAGMSERSLTRRFQDETQTTWRAFLQTARLLRAMELLATNGARVGDVAAKVGFDSVSAFTRAFERLAGESPKAYRQRQTS